MLDKFFWPLLIFSVTAAVAMAQSGGTVRGTVVLDTTGEPLHSTRVTLTPIGRTVDTADDGTYAFTGVPPGTYDVIALSPALSDEHQTVRVTAGETVIANFRLRLAAVRESVTVTGTGREESPLNQVQSVATLDQLQLATRSAPSLGEVLDGVPGVSKRSGGPGTSRPVIRGFDGDRVLILEDGIRTGSLSSQSGDHGEPIDVNKLERVEVVRGPATLLYGSNAIGGVVNAVSRNDIFHGHASDGLRGYLTTGAGSNNSLGAGTGGFEYGKKAWTLWGSGGGQRSGDYQTPLGGVPNSQTRMEQADAGFGRYGEKSLFSFNYGFTDSKYGVPMNQFDPDAEVADLLMRRHTFKTSFGWKGIGFLEDIQGRVSYSDYNHQELVDGMPQTDFFNNQFIYRSVFNQKRKGALSGSLGFWGMRRDYETVGEEALAPPTVQNSFAAFAVETLDYDTLHFQFGGRVESNRYHPLGLQPRSFTGFSAGAGVSKRLWENGSVVANYSHSFRAPSIEELYNNGPHPGNLTFELGNPNLKRERNEGVDLSVRHHSERVRAEVNYFYYRIQDFVYLAPTGAVVDGLIEANYFQQNSRFTGGEAKMDLALRRDLWLNLSVDGVDARLNAGGLSLPRIPPVRGRVGFDATYKGFNVRPEVVLSNSQTRVFSTETPTPGYVVMNVTGTYTIAKAHALHQFSVNVFNAGDRLYRNHLSFIKSFAPEIGRGVRVGYTMQFF